MQIEVALKKLGQQDLELPEITRQLKREQIDMASLKEAVKTLRQRLLKLLTATNPKVGKACDMDCSPAKTMLVPSTNAPSSFSHQFNVCRVDILNGELADLKDVFPLFSADAVQHKLLAWSKWVATEKLGVAASEWTIDQKRYVNQRLRRQGEIW